MNKLLIIVAAAILCACGSQQPKVLIVDPHEVMADMHNAENSLDYLGVYTGTLPAADCPGIETTLTLLSDGKFVLHSKFIDRDMAYEEMGRYSIEGNMLSLQIDDRVLCYKIEENRLRMLDADKQEVTGALANYYVLTKNN